jgi:hypothetical protein
MKKRSSLKERAFAELGARELSLPSITLKKTVDEINIATAHVMLSGEKKDRAILAKIESEFLFTSRP